MCGPLGHLCSGILFWEKSLNILLFMPKYIKQGYRFGRCMHPVLCHWAGLRDCYCLIRRYSNEEQEIYRTCKYHHIDDLGINTQHIPSMINFYFRETGTLESYVSENGNSLQKKRRNKKNWIIEYSSLPIAMLRHLYTSLIFVEGTCTTTHFSFGLTAFLPTSTFTHDGLYFWPSGR